MIELPNFDKRWDHENGFYLTAPTTRFGKLIAHYELFKMTEQVPGSIVECGVFKGASFVRFGAFRDLFGKEVPLVGFDTFGAFPASSLKEDAAYIKQWEEDAGKQSISKEQLMEVLKKKDIKNAELVEGDVVQTVPAYVKANPNLQISLLNLDTDIYDPAVAVLEHLWPKIAPGGILIVDDYKVFPGETQAVDEYFKGSVEIKSFPFAKTPHYIVKQ